MRHITLSTYPIVNRLCIGIFCLFISLSANAQTCNDKVRDSLAKAVRQGPTAVVEVAKKIILELDKEQRLESYLQCADVVVRLGFRTNSPEVLGFGDLLFSKARTMLASVGQTSPEDEDICDTAKLAAVGNLLGDFKSVLALYEKINTSPDPKKRSELRCEALLTREIVSALMVDGRLANAATLVRKTLESEKFSKRDKALLSVTYGSGLLSKGKYMEAFGAFEDATVRSSDSGAELAIAHYWLALRAKSNGEHKLFRRQVKEAIKALDGSDEVWARDLYSKLMILTETGSGKIEKSSRMKLASERLSRDSSIAAWR